MMETPALRILIAPLLLAAACGAPQDAASGSRSAARVAGLGSFEFGSDLEHIRPLCASGIQPAPSQIFRCSAPEVDSPFDRFDAQLVFCADGLCGVILSRYYPLSELEGLRGDVLDALRDEYGRESSSRDLEPSTECSSRQNNTAWNFGDGSSVRVSLVCVQGAGEHLVVQFGTSAFWSRPS